MTSPRIVEIRQRVLEKNDLLARSLRRRFQEAGVSVVNFLSSPGAGKTTLLQETVGALQADMRVATLVGDLATERDAARLAAAGAPVRQITTGETCHLDAQMIDVALRGWDLRQLDLLFIENVGNLVCPASYDLGESLRVVLLSVTEGEDKPLKYPPVFFSADLALITKSDLSQAAGFSRNAAWASLEAVHPGIPVIEMSVRSGEGMPAWLSLLRNHRSAATPAAAVSGDV